LRGCLWFVFLRWNEPFPTDRKAAAGLSSVIELKNEFIGDIERYWQGNHWSAGAIGSRGRIVLDHTDPPFLVLCAENPALAHGVNYKRCASCDRSLAARGMAESAGDSRQFGNGFRLDRRNSVINFRIASRRWCSASTSRCSPARSPSYHSSGISAAHRQMVSASISSALVSAGSNEFHPATPSYTQLFAYTPRSGQSGKLHSLALKQYPWSMKVAWCLWPRRVLRQKIACLPSLLHVHLSRTRARAKSPILTTP